MEEFFDEGLADITERYIDFFTQSPTWLICTYIAFMIVTLFYVVKYCDTLHPIIWTALALAFPFISLVVIVVHNTLVVSKRRKQAPDNVYKLKHGVECRKKFIVSPLIGAVAGLVLGFVSKSSNTLKLSFSEWMLSGALLIFVIVFLHDYLTKSNRTRYFIVRNNVPVVSDADTSTNVNGHIISWAVDNYCSIDDLKEIINHYYSAIFWKNLPVSSFCKTVECVKYDVTVLKETDYALIKDVESAKEIEIIRGYRCHEIQYVEWCENEENVIPRDSRGFRRKLWRVRPVVYRLILEIAVSLAVIFTLLTPVVMNMHLFILESILSFIA